MSSSTVVEVKRKWVGEGEVEVDVTFIELGSTFLKNWGRA